MASILNSSISLSLLPSKTTPFSPFTFPPSSSLPHSLIRRKPDPVTSFAGISKRRRRKTRPKLPPQDMSVTGPSRVQESVEVNEPYQDSRYGIQTSFQRSWPSCEVTLSQKLVPEFLFLGDTATRNKLLQEKEMLLPMDIEGQTDPSSAIARKKIYYFSSITCFGVDLSPDTIAVAMVYFVQGVLGLSRLAVSFYLKDDLHLDPAETAVISGVSALPWLIKPLYGFISDSLPLFGYRRRSYLVLSGLLGALSWTLMAIFVDSKYGAAFCILLGSLSVAFSDVVVDSMVVERARGESQSTSGSLQSLCWGSSAFGGIVSAYFSGSLVDAYGVRFVFGITALLPLITSAVAVLVKEQRTTGSSRKHASGQGFFESSKQNLIQLFSAIRQPTVFLPTLFIFLWQATPHSDSAMFYFTTNKLGFTPEFLGRVKLVTSVASLLGVGLYNGFLKAVPLRKIFLVTTIIGSALGMSQVFLVTGINRQFGISDEWFAIGDSLIITVLGQASFMPVLVLAARLCPEGMEATLFATLMSISNGGSVVGGLMGAGLTQLFGITRDSFDNLAWLVVLCNLSSLLPLPLLGLLPKEKPETATKGSAEVEMKSN